MRASHLLLSVTALAALGWATPAAALYRVVGPDGRVTYTDRVPEANGKASAIRPAAENPNAAVALPYELRQAVAKFPVTLYTKDKCEPCSAGRAHLRARGVPYTEKTIGNQADAEAFQRLEGTSQIPVLRIGGQQILGFASGDWAAYLDAAGYPKKSVLPASYRFPAASPLVSRDTLPSAPAGASGNGASAPRTPPAPTPIDMTPGGIRF